MKSKKNCIVLLKQVRSVAALSKLQANSDFCLISSRFNFPLKKSEELDLNKAVLELKAQGLKAKYDSEENWKLVRVWYEKIYFCFSKNAKFNLSVKNLNDFFLGEALIQELWETTLSKCLRGGKLK